MGQVEVFKNILEAEEDEDRLVESTQRCTVSSVCLMAAAAAVHLVCFRLDWCAHGGFTTMISFSSESLGCH